MMTFHATPVKLRYEVTWNVILRIVASLFGSPAGSRALDLMNTLDWRDDPARRSELLTNAPAFREWAGHVGFPATITRGIRHERQRRRAIPLREAPAIHLGAWVRG